MNTNKQRLLIVTLLFLIVGGCAGYATVDLPVRAPAQEDHMYWESVHRGALLYANNCRTCHGNQGEGGIAPALNVPEWRNQDPIALADNRDLLTHTLNCGRAGTLMPPWLNENGGALNERQIAHIVNLITAPEDGEEYVDELGQTTNAGWAETIEFAHNLNLDLAANISGDTLQSIADQHNIGVELLAEANNVPMDDVDDTIPRGETIQLPANGDHPDGFDYLIRGDFDTIRSLASNLFIGAAAIADLNDIDFGVDYVDRTFALLDDNGEEMPGLLPGEGLALPEGATYTVFAGDTLEGIAEQHSASVGDIRALNEDLLEEFGDSDEMDGQRRLALPPEPTVAVSEGDTWETIASRYDLNAEQLASLNDTSADENPAPGDVIVLPDGSRYIVQELETFGDIATRHDVEVATLQQLNNIDDPDAVTSQLVLELPQIDAYIVAGQTLEEASADFGNVNGASLAAANDLEADANVRIGTSLQLPEDSTGTAPPDTENDGAACLYGAVPMSVYEEIAGETEAFEPEAPEEFTDELIIRSYAIDWTFEADDEELEPNRGVAKIRPGTTVTWENPGTVRHTVTIDGTNESGDFEPGATFEFTFDEPGEYQITCDYHGEQDGYVFVEEE